MYKLYDTNPVYLFVFFLLISVNFRMVSIIGICKTT